MSGLDPAALLDICERGRALHPIDRALLLVAAGSPGEGGAVAALPLAERDRRLLELRRDLIGDRLDCVTQCPACGEGVEFALSADAVIAGLASPQRERIDEGGWTLELRPLDSRDLAVAAAAPDMQAAIALLAARAISYLAGPDGMDAGAAPPDAVRGAAARRVHEREAGGLAEVALGCAGCGQEWADAIDVAGHVWVELETAAARLLAEIATLAARFGWSEAALLAMPAARRRAYLALAA